MSTATATRLAADLFDAGPVACSGILNAIVAAVVEQAPGERTRQGIEVRVQSHRTGTTLHFDSVRWDQISTTSECRSRM